MPCARVDYVSFDDPAERDFAAADPAGFLARLTGRAAILEEIQYVPGLLSHLKLRIDAEPEHCGRWLLTGSQQFGLMRDAGESLAGRVAILELPPFAHGELPRASLEKTLWNGGYPIPALHPGRRDLWLRGYVATYLERDARQIRNIPDLRTFSQFLSLAAARHGQEFHPADLARELGGPIWGVRSCFIASDTSMQDLTPRSRSAGLAAGRSSQVTCTSNRGPDGSKAVA